jgi:hypothetical protein
MQLLFQVDLMNGRRLTPLAGLVLSLACASSAWAQTAPLTVALDVEGDAEQAYQWSIDKQVTPTSADRFIGETQQLGFRLVLTKGAAQERFVVRGDATLTNTSGESVEVTGFALEYGGTLVANGCTTGSLAPGASLTCPIEFQADSGAGATLELTADTTAGEASGSASVAFGLPGTIHDSVTVVDPSLSEPLTFSASGVHEYTLDLTCVDGNTRSIKNVATIQETGASDSVSARVACHATRMERAAQPTPDRRWSWDIQKSHAQAAAVELAAGGSFDVTYTIVATATASEGGNVVTGSINAVNTHPTVDAQLVSVEAWIDGIPATTNCPSLTVPKATYGAGGNVVLGRISCPFTLTLPDGHVATLVTGKVTQQLFDYSPTGTATADGTRVLSGSQPVSAAASGETDECVQLGDLYLGTTHDLGQFCATPGNTSTTRTFVGTIRVEADDECEFDVPNLARLTTNDTGTIDQDDTLVSVVRTDCVADEAMGIELDARGNLTRTFPWTIDKTVTPASSDRFIGETQELAYTLRVTRGAAQDSGYVVSGNASVSNDGSAAFTITSITVTYGGTPVTHGCVPGPLAAGATLTCPLSFPVPDATSRPLVFTVRTSNGNEATQTVDVAFGAPTTVNETITVDDTLLDENLSFSESGTHEYTHDVTCIDGNTRVVDNTATIVETGANDSARARVACHAIRMERAATTGGGTRWSWDIDKTHAQATPLQLAAGQTFIVDYTITATATSSASGSGTVSGYIAVLNTHPLVDAQLISVEAWIDGIVAATNCPSLVVPHATTGAGGVSVPGRLECPFTVDLPDGHTAQLVTGRVTQQLFDYSATGVATLDGTKVLQGSQAVTSGGSGGETDECVRLSDVYNGTTHDLGEFCASAGNTTVTRNFSGMITVAGDAQCAYQVPNIARLVTNDSGTTDEDQTLVSVERTDCGVQAACVRTQGYWRTHSAFGPAPYDATWAAIGENTPFFGALDDRGNALTWYRVMWIAPKGNAYFNLATQFVAATLNIEAGATASTQVLDALDQAQAIFETYSVQQVGALRGNNELRVNIIELAGVLDMYNNGEGSIGTAHCSEDKTSGER